MVGAVDISESMSLIPKGGGRREEDSGGRDGQEPERPRQPGVPRALQEHSRDAKVVGGPDKIHL